METSEINFCNGKAYNIKNIREKSDILKYINDKYSITINNNNIYSYNNKILPNLVKYNYFVSTITQGNVYMLFLTKIHNQNYSILIDHKISDNHHFPKLIIVNFRFSEELFNDTILKGELIKNNNNKWQFIIDDIVVYQGKLVKINSLIDKIKLKYNILENYYIKDNCIDLCELKIKKYFTYDNLDYLIKNFIPKCEYKIVGINFHSLNTKINTIKFHFFNQYNNINQTSLKYNFLKDNNSLNISKKNEQKMYKNIQGLLSIDAFTSENRNICDDKYINNTINKDETFTFLVKTHRLPNIYKLYCLKDNKIYKHSIAKIDTIECASFMLNLFKLYKEKYYIECYYYKDFNKWVPKNISNKNINSYYEILNYLKLK